MSQTKAVVIWTVLAVAIVIPISAAAMSPFLQWRDEIYIAAGFAGIIGLALLLIQPLLIGNHLPGISPRRSRQIHRIIGALLLAAVILHVVGLWITSPPDVIDALLFVSPTPFSVWGVIAMWCVFATALFAAFRKRLRLSPATWRRAHSALAAVIVTGTVVHALLIEGAMETVSKAALCLLVVIATLKLFADLKVWRK